MPRKLCDKVAIIRGEAVAEGCREKVRAMKALNRYSGVD
jgi:ABC-type Na+ transport system ATPase subunit NatA